MKIFKILFVTIVSLAVLASCKKEDSHTNNEFLTRGFWNLTELREDLDNDGDIYEEEDNRINGCEGDDIYSFHTDGLFLVENGVSKCSLGQPYADKGNWWLSGDEKTLVLMNSVYMDTFQVVALTFDHVELHEIQEGRTELVIILEK